MCVLVCNLTSDPELKQEEEVKLETLPTETAKDDAKSASDSDDLVD